MFAKVMVTIASIILLPAAAQTPTQPIGVQDIDLGSFKCGDFIKGDAEATTRIMFWLGGYYTYEDDSAVIGVAKLKDKERQLKQYCADNSAIPLITASEIFMDKKFGK
jgi:hypothetical protein